jgi:hypothetical protein
MFSGGLGVRERGSLIAGSGGSSNTPSAA